MRDSLTYMAHPFVVGETYFDRKGNFIVLAIYGNNMEIQYEDGTKQTGEVQVKTTIYRNILGEQRNLHPYQSPGLFETIGFFAKNADFQAEVPPQAQHGFEEQYKILTNTSPVLGQGGYYPVRALTQEEKWGPELRIYFPSGRSGIEIPPDIEIRSATTDDTVRINNNRFWWQLVRVGFRLGTRHDITKIRNSVPAKFRNDFDRGNK